MRQLSLFGLVLSLVVILLPLTGYAQGSEQPLVLFIEDARLATASMQDTGPDGLSELARIFEGLGARTGWIYLGDPVPEEARVVVLARPLQPIPVADMVRLWVHVLRGNHLLLTIDPIGPTTYRGEGAVRANPDRATAGLPTLLWLVYGIGLQDTVVAEPWFTTATVSDNRTAHLTAYVEDIAQHPVTAPLSAFGLPVQLWGARSMRVEPIGPHSYAVPLLYTLTAYGETNQEVFTKNAPLEVNLGPDPVGRLLLGALAENTLNGSRVVVLGDSESVENGYGLLKWPGTDESIHVANRVLAERLAAWLLDQPVEEWPSLPDDFTWLALDGNAADWTDSIEITPDDPGDALVPRYDIRSLRAFRDDRFFYALIELADSPNPDTRVTFSFGSTFDDAANLSIIISRNETLMMPDNEESVPVIDGRMTIDTVIEIRLPLRIIGDSALLKTVCLSDSRTPLTSPAIDCTIPLSPTIPVATTLSPVDTWHFGPRAIVDTPETGVNVRSGPGTDTRIVATAYHGQVFSVIGRTALGDWLQVQNAVYTGWIASPLVKTDIDIGELSIVFP